MIVDEREGKSRSFVRNFSRFVRNLLLVSATVNEDLADISGVARKAKIITGGITDANNPRVVGAVLQIRFGIGTAAVQSTDFELNTVNASLMPSNTNTTILTEDSVKSGWKIEGQSTNTSGSSLTVNEMALYAVIVDANASANRTIMMIRDLVTPGVVVANGLTILGRYTITVAV
ncbi:MAG: hypothetical protein QXP41_00505 [Candidatus Nitrosocaldus sp.]